MKDPILKTSALFVLRTVERFPKPATSVEITKTYNSAHWVLTTEERTRYFLSELAKSGLITKKLQRKKSERAGRTPMVYKITAKGSRSLEKVRDALCRSSVKTRK